jgi:hypothetical protein
MMYKPILDDRKKEFRGLTIHKNGAISSSKVCVKSTHMSSLNECLEVQFPQTTPIVGGFFRVIMEPHQTSQHVDTQSVGDCRIIK